MGKPLERDYRRWLQKYVQNDLEEARKRKTAEQEVFKQIRDSVQPSVSVSMTLTVTKEV